MKLPQLKRRDQIIASVIGIAVFIFLLERFVFSTLRLKIKELSQQIKAEEADLKSGIEIENDKDKIRSEYRSYQSYLKVAENASEQEVIAKFLKEIERMAQESGISIVNLSPQSQAESAAGYKKYNAELRAEGSPDKIYDFLYKIQNSALLIKLDKLNIAPKDPQAELLKLETTISLAVI